LIAGADFKDQGSPVEGALVSRLETELLDGLTEITRRYRQVTYEEVQIGFALWEANRDHDRLAQSQVRDRLRSLFLEKSSLERDARILRERLMEMRGAPKKSV
jgi:hypothetical protein